MSRLLSLLALSLLAATALSADWPCFRGTNRDDISPDKGLLKSWPKDGPKMLWKCKGIGSGFSTVSIAGNLIYTLGNKGNDTYVFAITRDKGEIKWSKKLGKAGGSLGCTPTVEGGLVFAIGQDGDFACYDAKDGEEKWRKHFKKDYGGRIGGWQYCESPLVDGDNVIVTPGGPKAGMVCFNKKTGKEVWKTEDGFGAGYSSIVISKAAGVKQYVTLTADGTVGVDAKTGKRLWLYKKLGKNTANIPTPIVVGDQIITVAGYGKAGALLTLTKDKEGAFTAKEEYYVGALRNKHGGVIKVGNYLFGDTDDSGNPYCAEWKTGKVKWTRREAKKKGQGSGSAAMTYADGHLYVRYDNGYMVLVPATADGYSEKGSFKIPTSGGASWAHPVVLDGKLYLREKDTLFVYDVKGK